MNSADIAQHIRPVALHLLGQPNDRLSEPERLRWGTHGSLVVEVGGEKQGTWYDHEQMCGGGVLDLIQARAGLSGRDAVDWMKRELHIEDATGPAPRPQPRKNFNVVAEYTYEHSEGGVAFQVLRLDPKDFRQRRPDPDGGGWVWKMKGVELLPYRLPEVAAAVGTRAILIVEGEKDVDNLRGLGFVATCNPGGAGKWPDHFVKWFRGADILLLPDNDDAGRDHVNDVARKLHGEVKSIKVLTLPRLPHKGDASNWIEGGGTRDQLIELAHSSAIEWDPATAPQPHAGGGVDGGSGKSRPVVRLENDKLHQNVNSTEELLVKSGRPIFVRAGRLVRPVTEQVDAANGKTVLIGKFRAMSNDEMADVMAETIRFEKFDGRSEDWEATKPPRDVAGILLNREGQWGFPQVISIITTPTLRFDGSLLSTPGYDAATRVYYAEDKRLQMPAIADRPSRDDALKALQLIKGLLTGFPFVSDVDHAVALSGILTAVCRPAMPVAPLHAVRATTAGSGKTYLVDVSSVIASGQRCPVITLGQTEEETEKRLGAYLMAGVPIVSIDNVNGEMGGDMLCQAVERPIVRVRILGRSEAPAFEVRSTFFATGNNLQLRGDMTRRAVVCNLDAGVERPELRAFDFSPVERVLAGRGAYVAAALTVVRAYLVAGQPGKLSPIGSYEVWSDMIRSCLVWLGEGDPVASMEKAREEDPYLVEIKEIFGQWRECLQLGTKYSTKTLVSYATDGFGDGQLRYPDLNDALMKAVGQGGRISSKSLGRWLVRNAGRVVSGMKIIVFPDDKNGNLYSLVNLE